MATEEWVFKAFLKASKFLNPQSLAYAQYTCKKWRDWGEEAWLLKIIRLDNDNRSAKATCKSQLQTAQFLATLHNKDLIIYFTETGGLVEMPIKGVFQESDFYSLISIPTDNVFCCGGQLKDGEEAIPNCYLLSANTGYSMQLPNMGTARMQAGLVGFDTAVYVFGGDDDSMNPSCLDRCEKFNFTNRSWTPLPNMSTPRSRINPARLKGSIYIAGGDSAQRRLDVLSLETEQFEQLELNLPIIEHEAIIYARKKDIVIVSHQALTLCNPKSKRILLTMRIDEREYYSSSGVVIYAGAAHLMLREMWIIGGNLGIVRAYH